MYNRSSHAGSVTDRIVPLPFVIAILGALLLFQGIVGARVSQYITPGCTMSVTGNMVVGVSGDWVNDGTFQPASGTVIFNGRANQELTHPSGQSFYNLTLEKTGGDLVLNNDITIDGDTLKLSGGDLDLNGWITELAGNSYLKETPGNMVKGETGHITATRNLFQSTELEFLGIN